MLSHATAADLTATHKDVVIAELGAAAAIVGLVLVFLGVLVTTYQTLLGQIGQDRLAGFRQAAWSAVAIFVAGLVSLTLNLLWLVVRGGTAFYITTLCIFFALLLALIAIAIYSARVLLR